MALSITRGKSVLIHSTVQPSLTPLRFAPKQTLMKLKQLCLVLRSADSIIMIVAGSQCLELLSLFEVSVRNGGSYHFRYIMFTLSERSGCGKGLVQERLV